MDEKEFAEKSIRLSFEFSKYLIEHPEFEEKIPEGAEVVILLEGDTEFNRKAKTFAERSILEGQQVIFIKVRGLAPMPTSRLISPELVSI